MSYVDNALVACANLQTNLDNAFTTGELVRDKIPALEALTSYQHPMRMLNSPGGGKERKVEVIYQQRLQESSVTEVDERGCTATAKPAELSTVYEMTGPIQETATLFTASHLKDSCRDNGEVFATEIARMLNAMRRKIATQVTGEVSLLSGNWSTDVTVNANNAYEVATQKANGDWDPEALVDINIAARDLTEYTGDYIVVANSDMWKYLKMIEIGCCANDGIDLRETFDMYGLAAMYDSRMATAMAAVDADAFLINIGSVQLLNYVEAPWLDGTPVGEPFRGATYISQVFTDPVTGLLMELTVKDECRGKAHVILNAQVQSKALPSDLFASGDKYEGVNGINKIAISNPY